MHLGLEDAINQTGDIVKLSLGLKYINATAGLPFIPSQNTHRTKIDVTQVGSIKIGGKCVLMCIGDWMKLSPDLNLSRTYTV